MLSNITLDDILTFLIWLTAFGTAGRLVFVLILTAVSGDKEAYKAKLKNALIWFVVAVFATTAHTLIKSYIGGFSNYYY